MKLFNTALFFLVALLLACTAGSSHTSEHATFLCNYSCERSLLTLDENLNKAVFQFSSIEIQKPFQHTAVPKLSQDAHSYPRANPAAALSVRNDFSPLPPPWHFQNCCRYKHRLSGWKDSNLLFKTLAIDQA